MKVSIVVPCMNEQGNVGVLHSIIAHVLDGVDFDLIFVDDGSTDDTLAHIKKMRASDPRIQYLSLSRNFGHMAALRAGLSFADGNCVITMDGDLQHPPELLRKMIEKWREGYEVVFTIRSDPKGTSFLKKISSSVFYTIINKLSDLNIQHGAADFRLMDRKVVDIIKSSTEYDLFLRGYIEWIGFRQIGIEYVANERHSGVTKYSLNKMIKLAVSGITSFSIKPLYMALVVGSFISLAAFFYGIYAVIIYFFTDWALPGWASMLASVLFLGGLQLLMLGVIGEYIGRVFIQTKCRPDYLVRESSKHGEQENSPKKCINLPGSL